jgi:hypothetical protein
MKYWSDTCSHFNAQDGDIAIFQFVGFPLIVSLRFDSREGTLRAGDSRLSTVTTGRANDSESIRRVEASLVKGKNQNQAPKQSSTL